MLASPIRKINMIVKPFPLDVAFLIPWWIGTTWNIWHVLVRRGGIMCRGIVPELHSAPTVDTSSF